MPIPTQSDVHAVNVPLTQLVEAFLQKQTDFVHNIVFPSVPVDHKSDSFYKWSRADFFRRSMKARAPGAVAESGGARLSTDTYTCNTFALRYPVADLIRRNADKMLNLDQAGTLYLAQQALMDREASWASAYFAASLWGTTMTGQATADATHVVFWGASGSTPIDDILTAKGTIKQNTGQDANVLVLGYNTKKVLKTNAQVIDRLKYGQTAPGAVAVKDSDLASLFEVERVVVMGAIETTSAEGAATDTFGFLGGNHALLAYAAPAPGIMVPSAGYTFNWTDFAGGATANGWRMKKFRNEDQESDILEIQQSYAYGLVSTALGYFFASVGQAS